MLRSVLRHAQFFLVAMCAQTFLDNLGVTIPGWLTTADRMYAYAILAGLGVVIEWNVWHALHGLLPALDARRERREEDRALRREQAAASMRMMPAYQAMRPPAGSSLRYMSLPSVTFTGPQPRVIEVHDGGACGKCQQPMARHTYYGTGPCVIALEGSERITGIDGTALFVACEICGGSVRLPRGEAFNLGRPHFCENCAVRYRLP